MAAFRKARPSEGTVTAAYDTLGRLARVTLGSRTIDWLRPFWRDVGLVLLALIVEVSYWTLVPLSLSQLVDNAATQHDVPLAVRLLSLMAIGFVAMMIASTGRSWITSRLGGKLLTSQRLRLFDHLQRLPPGYFARETTGDVSARFLTDLNTVESALTLALPELVWGTLQIVTNVPLLYALNVPLAFVACLVIPFAMIGPRVLAPRVAAAGYARRAGEGHLLTTLQEQITGQPVIRAFGLQLLMRHRVRDELELLGRHTANEGFQTRLVSRSTTFGSAFGQLLVFATGSVLVFRGDLTVGTFVGFIGLLLNIGEGARWLGFGLPAYMQAAGPWQRLDEIYAEPAEAPDPPDAGAPSQVAGDVVVEDVGFTYPNAQQASLDGVSLQIADGWHVAIVGASGSGKSTLLQLLMRAYDPDAGRILVGGHDARRLRRDTLRRAMGVVFQESFLFAGSVRDNIRLGWPPASDADVEAAAQAAQLHDAIQALPAGYDTPVGERGAGLSGGQRQRVALARAILRDPAILLLDEPTSALDPVTETDFNRTLRRVAAGRTVISVTHRLQSVVDADQIFVLRHGRLVQRGTHTELLAESTGAYAELWASQTGFSVSLDEQGLRAEVSPHRLARIPLFRDLAEPALVRLARQFAPQEVAPDQVIVRQGDMGDRFYLVVRGRLEVTQTTATAGESELNVVQDGDYFGEIALLRRVARSATVRARTPGILLSLASQHFEQLLADESSVREAIERIAEERLRANVTPG